MIIRVFRPTIHPGKEVEFEAFLRDTAVPLVSQQAGLVAQHVGRPRDPSSTEYVYVTVWEGLEPDVKEAIRYAVDNIRRFHERQKPEPMWLMEVRPGAFAGERWQQAVITPDEEHLLKDTWIGHYEVLSTPG